MWIIGKRQRKQKMQNETTGGTEYVRIYGI